jgi:hypothetical protein
VRVETFRLQKDAVSISVWKLDDLVLDGWAVTGSARADLPAVERRTMQVFLDNAMRYPVRVCYVTGNLREPRTWVIEGEPWWRVVAGLFLQNRVVDRSAIEPRAGTRLEPSSLKAESAKRFAQSTRSAVTSPPPGSAQLTDVEEALQEGAGSEHCASRMYLPAATHDDAGDSPAADNQVTDLALHHGQADRGTHDPSHPLAIAPFVRLGPRGLNGWALACIQSTELNPTFVDRTPHLPTERIDFANEMTLADSPDRRVARHLAYAASVDGNHQR